MLLKGLILGASVRKGKKIIIWIRVDFVHVQTFNLFIHLYFFLFILFIKVIIFRQQLQRLFNRLRLDSHLKIIILF